MATGSFFALFDDIATLLDDIALMSKVAARQGVAAADDVTAMTKIAAQKTAGVLGDDLALNAQQVTGIRAERELPVVWAVAKGSLRNKAILVPAALAISAAVPSAIVPLLMLGGLYLCFEGAEKLWHAWLHRCAARIGGDAEDAVHHAELVEAVADEAVDMVAFERDKIRGAIRTDFILSAEIIVITLGTVEAATLATRTAVLIGVSLLMTVGVYGLVGAIVKLDDLGLYLCRAGRGWRHALGGVLLRAAPWLMKALSVLGTAAMFLVGGGILAHGLTPLHHMIAALAAPLGAFESVAALLLNGAVGLLAGAIAVPLVSLVRRMFGKAH